MLQMSEATKLQASRIGKAEEEGSRTISYFHYRDCPEHQLMELQLTKKKKKRQDLNYA